MAKPTPFERRVAQALMHSLANDDSYITAGVLPLVLAVYREELITHFLNETGTSIRVMDMRAGISCKPVKGEG